MAPSTEVPSEAHTSGDVSLEEFLTPEYDFIICGGGTAGLVLAARLTEVSHLNVGVIEAGQNKLDDPKVNIPALALSMWSDPEYDWSLNAEPQGPNGVREAVPRGKMLGGSSGINLLQYVRGSDQDYDDWAELAGDQTWSAENLKKYMRKHQTLEPIHDSIIDRSNMPIVKEYHGTKGPIHTSFSPVPSLPIDLAAIQAADHVIGRTTKPLDPWSGDHMGFFNNLITVSRTGKNNGYRSYAARDYFEPVKERPNLKVLCEALVTKVILEGDTAVGVEFRYKDGSTHVIRSKREVILSAGSVKSPHILHLSGIGDPNELETAGIDLKIAAPTVGKNLQDHYGTFAIYELERGVLSADALFIPGVLDAALKEYIENRTGLLNGFGGIQGYFPIRDIVTEAELEEIVKSIEETPDQTPFQRRQYRQVISHLKSHTSANIQLFAMNNSVKFDNPYFGEDYRKVFEPPANFTKESPHGITLALFIQYPVGRGWIKTISPDPTVQPLIHTAHMSHPADINMAGATFVFSEKAVKAPSLQDKIARRVVPGEEYDMGKKDDRIRAAGNVFTTEFHLCGSCAMGDTLDSRLKVIGANGLRVIDASIFPNQISGNLVGTVYMLAEKAADLIKEEYGWPIED